MIIGIVCTLIFIILVFWMINYFVGRTTKEERGK